MLLIPLGDLVKVFVKHCFSGNCREFGVGCICRCTRLKVATIFQARSVCGASAFVLEKSR